MSCEAAGISRSVVHTISPPKNHFERGPAPRSAVALAGLAPLVLAPEASAAFLKVVSFLYHGTVAQDDICMCWRFLFELDGRD